MELFVNYLLITILNLFDMYIIFRYMTIFFGKKYIDRKLAAIAYLTRLFLSFIITCVELYPPVTAIIALGSFFLVSLCYSSTVSKRFAISILIYMCSFAAEVIAAIAVGLSKFDAFGKIKESTVLFDFVIELLFWGISLVVRRFRNVKETIPVPKAFGFAIAVIPSSLICLEIIIFSQNVLNSMMAGISLVCLISSILMLIYLYDSLSTMFSEHTKAAIVLKEKEYYHNQSVLLKEKYEELRQYRHDMKNRMIVIQQLLKKEQYNTVSGYTEEIVKKLVQAQMYSNTGNLTLDSIINYKLVKLMQSDVSVETNITIPENVPIDEDDMVVIFGNLLDNAIEAIERMEENIEKYIGIDFGFEMGNAWICIRNSYDDKICTSENQLVTWKDDKSIHGIGLRSVEAVVQKYNGLMEISMEERLFTVDILLYL